MVATFCVLAVSVHAAEFESIFNGKDLSGWAGKAGLWSVEDGAIVGQTTKEHPVQANTFLVWQGEDVGDFVLKLKVRFAGNNTGVQYRSELLVNRKTLLSKGIRQTSMKNKSSTACSMQRNGVEL